MMLENILADFELLDDWEDRYRYVIELGRSLPPLPEAARAEANKMRGRRPGRRAGAAVPPMG
jgi:cysteine desulfuration protein SufE